MIAKRQISTHNEAAEKAFLASLVNAYITYPPEQVPAIVLQATARVQPSDFGVIRLGEMYGAALEMLRQGKRPEYIGLARHLAATDGSVSADVLGEIDALGDPVSCQNINHYAGLIREASAERQAKQISEEMAARIEQGEDFRAVAARGVRHLSELSATEDADADWATAEDMAGLVMDAHDQAKLSDRRWTGLDCGFEAINDTLDGLSRAEMTVIGARPGMGKTTLALQFALSAMREEGVAVGMLSLEMTKKQIGERMLSILTGIPVHAIRRGETAGLGMEDRLAQASQELARMSFHCNDRPGLNVIQAGALMRRLEDKAQIGLWIVDYVQLMTGPEDSENERLEVIAKELKALCKLHNAPLLVLSQFSRAPEGRTDRKPQLSDFRGSGGIEQAADNALLLYRPAYYGMSGRDGQPDNLAIVNAAKTRFGQTGEIELSWQAPGIFANPAPTYRVEPPTYAPAANWEDR